MLLEKIEIVEKRYDDIYQMISNPDIIADQKKYIQLNKELKELSKLVETGKMYKNAVSQKLEAEEYLNSSDDDDDMIAMAKEELDLSKQDIKNLEEEIKILLIPKDPEDSKNVVVEIRAGTGGDEASIFAGDLYRMYTKFAQDRKWKISVVDTSEGNDGGFKEVIFEISGQDVYGILKYESGVHRVQRVPQTETQGRVHTSAASVIVLPEAEEFDVELNMQDVRIERTTSTGPGGQSVNTTYSAIKLHHEPTGMIVSCQDQKSSHKNLEKALKVLRSRLYEIELAKKQAADSEKRKSMVSSGDRSAKIRTYNYPQGRITDHRINLTLYKIDAMMDGDISDLLNGLAAEHQADLLAAMGDS